MSTNASSSANAAPAPAIRTFQMDSGAIGNLSSSVNLFRGDVNLSQTLFNLPGRSPDNGLDVVLALQYQSNVHEQAHTWNREAATGVVGLGWTFPLTWIEAVGGASPLPGGRQYTLYDNGSPSPLVRQAQAPVVARLAATLASQLVAGQPVPAALLDAIRALGLALDAGTLVEGNGPWTLADDAGLQLYTLALEAGALCLRDGGEFYQLQSYQFWRVMYYPRYERWVIVSDAAVRRSFGARSGQAGAIAWQVWWTDADGVPRWRGASSRTEQQQRVAAGWYLDQSTDRFGNAVQYRYATVEQAVGDGGLAFTKAVYLDRIVDTFGRQVLCRYGDKLWLSGDEQPREYADPHRSVPSDAASAWQDRYETRYLSGIDVLAQDAQALFSVRFEYAPRPQLTGPERQVANVTGNSGRLRGDTYKRFLTGIRMVDAAGVSQPGLLFSYHLDPEDGQTTASAPAAAPGALAGIVYPEGGSASYRYRLDELSICQRSLTMPRPPQLAAGASPRVYFGADYVVVCYYDQSATQLSMQVCTWAGSWITWQLDPATPLLDSHGLDLSTLDVLADADVLVLHFQRVTPNERVAYVFQRDTARTGAWLPGTIAGITTAPDVPPLVIDTVGVELTFLGGASYFLVARNVAGGNASIDRYTWRWPRREWGVEHLAADAHAWVAAGPNDYAVLDGRYRLALHTLDADLVWRDGTAVPVAGLIVNTPADVVLVMGDGMAAISNLQAGNSQSNTYGLWLAQWNAAGTLGLSSFGPFTDIFGEGNPPTSWRPQLVPGGLVAVNSHLLRFDGVQWLANEHLDPGALPTGRSARYAFGPDYALQIIVPTTGVGAAEARVLGFDPQRDRLHWDAQPVVPADPLPPQNSGMDNWPSAGGEDYATVGPRLYCRGNDNDWGQVVTRPALADLATRGSGAQYDSQSLVDAAPTFLAWTVIEGSVSQRAQALLIHNGQVIDAALEGGAQRIVTPGADGISGPGVSPQGPDVFVSFPASATSFDTASQISLHRHTANALSGPIRHYAVAVLSIDDGYQEPMSSAYLADTASAGCSADGRVVKYFRTAVHPGTADPLQTPYGRVLSFYLNGIADVSGDNALNMLDGMLLRTEIRDRDDLLKAATGTTWKVFREVAGDPLDPAAPRLPLHGGFVAAIRQESLSDGVTTVAESAFVDARYGAPYGSGVLRQSSTNHGADGTAEVFVQAQGYAATVVPALRAIQAFADPAEQRTLRSAAGIDTVVQAVACTYRGWPSRIGTGVITCSSEASFGLLDAADPAFPYASYQPGQTPSGWVLAARTTARSADGHELQSLDPLGVPTATLYSRDLCLAVARVPNASVQGAAFLGFQDYEDDTPFHPQGLRYDSDMARIGTRSAVLPAAGAGGLRVQVSPHAGAGDYLVGCWYRTASGYQPVAGSGWLVQVEIDGVAQPAQDIAFADTGGNWQYRSIGVPVQASAGQSVRITLSVRNAAAADVWLNALLLVPLVNGLVARWFDVASQQFTASMDAGGRTSRTCFDQAWQPTLSIGASGQARELAQRFQSRRGSADGRFDPGSPNAELTLHPAAGGIVESFRDGGDWRTRWQATPDSAWSVRDGQLWQAGTAPTGLQWLGAVEGPARALYFELAPSGAALELSLSWGDFQVRCASDGYSGSLAGRALPALGGVSSMARHWLLVNGDGVVLFFADGQLLFSRRGQVSGSNLRLDARGAPFAVRHLAVLGAVRLGLSWNDGATRQRQVQQLHGSDTRVNEIVFDALGRQVATTRVAPGSFGSGAARAPLQYSAGFLDVTAFLAALDGDWAMRGDIADYYRGQLDDGVPRSDDGGYPYRGVRYEASPRRQQIETSLPGKAHAIDLQVPAADRRTLQYAFASNGLAGALPADAYAVNQLISPLKNVAVQIDDQMGQQVGTRFLDAQGQSLSSTEGLRAYRDAQGLASTLSTRLPNATTAGPQNGGAAFVQTAVADGLQRPLQSSDPDTGSTDFVCDDGGRTRFVRPAQDADESWLVYYKYDPLGRMVEQGVVEHVFDRAALARLANVPDWPGDGQVAVSTRYDGDGNGAAQIGKKIQVNSFNPAPSGDPEAGALSVTETFAYDSAGQIQEVRQQTAGAVVSDARTGYAYNTLSEVLRIELPAGAPLAAVHYLYNDQGWIAGVGTALGQVDLGAYTHSADGDVQRESLGAGAWVNTTAYASPGWALSLATRSADGSQQLSFSYDYDADGAVRQRSVAYDFPELRQTLSDRFDYDGQRRLQSASGDLPDLIRQYDPNGNIWVAEVGGQTQSFECEAGSDRLATASFGSSSSSLRWSPRGQLLGGLERGFEYDRTTSMTTRVSAPAGVLRLAYGGSQQRVLKQVRAGGGGAQVYVNGASQVPVAMLREGRWSVLVQGPLGLLAQIGETTTYPLKDITRSTWALVDGAGLRGRWHYRPFGELVGGSGGDGFSNLFQGQEWDAETGLYNFKARLYDPRLRRFLSPDPARQFASPYLFAGNNPLVASDPSGEISIWAQVGIGAALVVITAVGFGLTLFTAGGSAAAAGAADAALLGAAEGAVVAGEVAAGAAGSAAAAGAAGAVAAAEGGVAVAAVAAEGAAVAGAAGAAEVAAGAAVVEAATATASWGSTLATLAVNTLGSSIMGAGISGLQYDINHGRDFTAKGFFEAMGIGAASGLISGGLGGAGALGVKGLTAGIEGGLGVAARMGGMALVKGAVGVLSSDVSTILTNVAAHQPWYQGLAESSIKGGLQGAASGAAGSLFKDAWSNKVSLARMAGVSDQTITRVGTLVERVQTAATSTDAYMVYGTAAFFVISGYAVWGATSNFKV